MNLNLKNDAVHRLPRRFAFLKTPEKRKMKGREN